MSGWMIQMLLQIIGILTIYKFGNDNLDLHKKKWSKYPYDNVVSDFMIVLMN